MMKIFEAPEIILVNLLLPFKSDKYLTECKDLVFSLSNCYGALEWASIYCPELDPKIQSCSRMLHLVLVR